MWLSLHWRRKVEGENMRKISGKWPHLWDGFFFGKPPNNSLFSPIVCFHSKSPTSLFHQGLQPFKNILVVDIHVI